jgi:hypothetical protein
MSVGAGYMRQGFAVLVPAGQAHSFVPCVSALRASMCKRTLQCSGTGARQSVDCNLWAKRLAGTSPACVRVLQFPHVVKQSGLPFGFRARQLTYDRVGDAFGEQMQGSLNISYAGTHVIHWVWCVARDKVRMLCLSKQAQSRGAWTHMC